MSFTTSVIVGVAELLAAAGVAEWVASGAYGAPGAVPQVFRTVMPPSPDRVILLTPYGITDLTSGDEWLGVQARARGTSPADVDTITDALRDTLHGRRDLTLGGIPCQLAERRSTASIGVDANDRHETTSNFALLLTRHLTQSLDFT